VTVICASSPKPTTAATAPKKTRGGPRKFVRLVPEIVTVFPPSVSPEFGEILLTIGCAEAADVNIANSAAKTKPVHNRRIQDVIMMVIEREAGGIGGDAARRIR